jgi:hypothetical protein
VLHTNKLIQQIFMNDLMPLNPSDDTAVPASANAKTFRPRRFAAPAAGKIRAELNLEKWPGVWQPSKSKNEKTLRALERQVTSSWACRPATVCSITVIGRF